MYTCVPYPFKVMTEGVGTIKAIACFFCYIVYCYLPIIYSSSAFIYRVIQGSPWCSRRAVSFSEKFCQDLVESFFGKQRARGGRNENPTAKQFMENTVSLRVQGSSALEPTCGNCCKSGRTARDVVDSSRVLKRKRYSARRKT